MSARTELLAALGVAIHPTADGLRAAGWSLVGHLEFEVDRRKFKRWTFKNEVGQVVSGEGPDDDSALHDVLRNITSGEELEPPAASYPALAAVVPGPKPEFQDRIVARLEEALAAARRGEFEGGLLLFERADSESLDWTILGTQSFTNLIGKLEVLKQQLLVAGHPPEGT